jgi:hypothetical protein
LDQSIDYRKADFLAEIAAKYAAAKTYNRALLVARSISIPRPKVTALTAVAAEYASSGQKDAAKQLLKEAIQSVQTADRFGKVYARSQIAVQYAAIGQSETASQIFKLAVQDASNETDLIRKPELLSQVAVGLLTAGWTERANNLIPQILQAAQNSEFLAVHQIPLTLSPLLKAQQYDFAIRLLQEVPNSSIKTRWASEISKSLTESGDYDRAIEIAQMTRNQSLVSSLSQQKSFLNALNDIVALADNGKFTDALKAAQAIPRSYYKALILTEIAIKLAETGQADQAEQTLIKAVQIGKTVDTTSVTQGDNFITIAQNGGLVPIAVRLAEAGRFSQALEVTQLIEKERYTVVSYKVLAMLNIADQYIKTGQTDKALETLSITSSLVSSLR